jgi:hypothetical protein
VKERPLVAGVHSEAVGLVSASSRQEAHRFRYIGRIPREEHRLGREPAAGATLFPFIAEAAANETAAVADAVEALRVGLKEANRSKLEAVVAPELSHGHCSGRVENRQQFLDNAASGAAPFHSLEQSDQTVALVGDTAIVRLRFFAEQESNGKVNNIRLGVLQVWQGQSGKWLLLARQTFNLPA